VYDVQDWAEVRRLAADGVAKTEIARRLGMSRTTVYELLARDGPPVYVRRPVPSLLDEFKDEIRAMLVEDPQVRATVMLERLRRSGYQGGISIVRDYVRQVRPEFAAAASFQRTTYLPGEIGQVDWWHLPVEVPVGKDTHRPVFGLVVTLPHSAAHATVFTLTKTTAAFCEALLGCLERLGGATRQLVFDNDTAIVASRSGRNAVLHHEVAALFGQLAVRGVAAPLRSPEFKGQVERTIHYLENSFLPLREFASLADLQAQHDAWAAQTAWQRHHRRVGAVVADAHRVEAGWLRDLPDPLPDVNHRVEVRVSKDGFVRIGNVDYSVPPGLAGRRVQATVSLNEVTLRMEGNVIGQHVRSWVPADVVADPAHLAALKEHRHARGRLAKGDVAVPAPNLAALDALVGAW
jgi:transposase